MNAAANDDSFTPDSFPSADPHDAFGPIDDQNDDVPF